MKEKKYNEIRLRKREIDKIAIDEMHLEDMDGNIWWLAIYRGNKRTSFWIKSKTKITVEIQDNNLKSKLVEQA